MLDFITQFAAPCATKGISIVPSWYKYIEGTEVDGVCELTFVFPNDIGLILLALVEILLRLGAIVAVGFIIYGGFMYMTSQGEPDKANNARQTLINAIIGLVLAIFATGIVAFIGAQLT